MTNFNKQNSHNIINENEMKKSTFNMILHIYKCKNLFFLTLHINKYLFSYVSLWIGTEIFAYYPLILLIFFTANWDFKNCNLKNLFPMEAVCWIFSAIQRLSTSHCQKRTFPLNLKCPSYSRANLFLSTLSAYIPLVHSHNPLLCFKRNMPEEGMKTLK